MTGHIFKISPYRIVSLFREIEHKLPGWWYSISIQHSGIVRLSVGPSSSCPDSVSRFMLSLRKYEDFVISIDIRDIDDRDAIYSDLSDYISKLVDIKSNVVVGIGYGNKGSIIPMDYLPRKHSGIQRDHIGNSIKTLFRSLLVNSVDLYITELYIGQCHLSVDTSIRGCIGDDEFDITNDIKGSQPGIHDSINACVNDLEFAIKHNLIKIPIDESKDISAVI